jgi:hypothetical protein
MKSQMKTSNQVARTARMIHCIEWLCIHEATMDHLVKRRSPEAFPDRSEVPAELPFQNEVIFIPATAIPITTIMESRDQSLIDPDSKRAKDVLS